MEIQYVITATCFITQYLGFIVGYIGKTDQYYDLSATISLFTYVYVAVTSKTESLFTPQIVQISLVLIWSTRLGLFHYIRVKVFGNDKRLFPICQSFPKLFGTHTLQSIWLLAITYPSMRLLLFDVGTSDHVQIETRRTHFGQIELPLRTEHWLGWAIFALGFLLECIADYQKFTFRLNTKNKNEFITSGLWSMCRHPNYLGEFLVWVGLFISSLPYSYGMPSGQAESMLLFLAELTNCSAICAALISPGFVFVLLKWISGVNMLGELNDKQWKDRKDYWAYKRRTNALFPKLI